MVDVKLDNAEVGKAEGPLGLSRLIMARHGRPTQFISNVKYL